MRNLLICGAFAAVAVAPALAQEVVITGNVALTTDYTFRGVSQTDESPAIQGGLDLSSGSFYLGTWASNINFGTGDTNLELDVYGGYKFAAGPVAFDVGIIGYLYPSASDDAAELDYWEGYIKPSIALSDQVTLGGAIYYSPEFTGETGDGWYYEVNGAFVVKPRVQPLRRPRLPDRRHARLLRRRGRILDLEFRRHVLHHGARPRPALCRDGRRQRLDLRRSHRLFRQEGHVG